LKANVLKGMGKGLKVGGVVKAVYSLSRVGVLVHAGVVVGAPYESCKARRKSYRFVDMLTHYGLDSVQYSIYTPLPGSRAFINALTKGILITGVWDYYICLHPVIKVGGSLLKPLKLLYESRFENYLFYLRRWLRSKLGVLKDFNKECACKGSHLRKQIKAYVGVHRPWYPSSPTAGASSRLPTSNLNSFNAHPPRHHHRCRNLNKLNKQRHINISNNISTHQHL